MVGDKSELYAQANPSFRFVVSIQGINQAVFTECSLPTIEWEVENVPEGGVNTYVHQLPGRRKPATITLKNGIGKTDLLDWYLKGMKETFERKPLTITLYNIQREAVVAWDIQEALPTKWNGSELKSDANTIAIQTLVFSCGEITVSYGDGA
ncbi:MAG: phage tail protein [Anaerolineae bacterium]|nr:phage tail protein [Anaerolineae bacterium]